MKQAKLESLLGRPLTAVEHDNLKLYLDIAYESLEDMLCSTFRDVTETRTLDTREGYHTVFTGFFTKLTSVKVGEVVIDPSEYLPRQWDNRNAKWFNSIVFNEKQCDGEIIVEADWGFEACMPADLQQLFAKLFAQVSAKNTTNSNVVSKQVEDFRIAYRTDATLDEQFAEDNANVISKYSLCSTMNGDVISGKVCYGRFPILR